MDTNSIIILCMLMVLLVIVVALRIYTGNKINKWDNEKKQYAAFSDDEIEHYSEYEHDESDDVKLTRQLINPDDVNSNPQSYLIMDDGGQTAYVRTFTIVMLPKRMTFAVTWSKIANYEGVISSAFVRRLSKKEASKAFDNHITVLQGEIHRAEDPEKEDPNRARKLKKQLRKATEWAEKSENDDDIFFDVGFLVTIKAPSLQELNLKSDSLFKAGTKAGMLLSNCYGLQEEAYKTNMPFNTVIKKGGREPVNWFLFDRDALATLYNHTRVRFVHENGVPIGSGLYDGDIATWDPYDKSHIHGYSAIFAGPPGVGKSATVKAISTRLVPFGCRFVTIDSQAINGRGEYVVPALSSGGIVYKIGRNSTTICNMFDIEPEIDKSVLVLDLKKKIESIRLSIMSMLQAEDIDFKEAAFLKEILRKAIQESYDEKGIVDGDVDSLYETGNVIEDGKIMSGKRKKEMPTLGFCYKQVLIDSRNETNPNKKEIYDVVLAAMSSWVKGVYYSDKSLTFIDKETYYKLETHEVNHRQVRQMEINGEIENVIAVEGQSAYFDGQSTIDISKKYPYESYDISGLTENERKIARTILISYIEERYVTPNNERIEEAEKIIIVVDEAKEHFGVGENTRTQAARFTRQCRKKNVGLWWILQAISDCEGNKDTEDVFKMSETKFIFKQDISEEEFMKKNLPLSELQRKKLYTLNGTRERNSVSYSKPGQVCLVDGGNVYFMQVDIMPSEKIILETDMRKLDEMRKNGVVFWDDIIAEK